MVVRLLILLLSLHALSLVAGDKRGSDGRRRRHNSNSLGSLRLQALQPSPVSFEIRDDQARVHTASIHIQNPNDQALAVQLSLRHPSTRRLSKDGIVVIQGDSEASVTGRRLQAAENCSQPLLLLRPRVSQNIRATRRLRRLAQLPGLENSTWLYLSHLGLSIAQLDCAANAEEVAKQLESEHAGEVEFVEVDKRNLFKMGITDTQWSRQWGMRRSGFDNAWSRLDAYSFEPDPVTVAVLDTGVQLDHEDLQGRLWQNPGEIPGNGIDDDGNGFIDDVHGWDFADGDADPSDDDGHGTHCAGVIGAAKNGRGVVGAFGGSSSVRIMALRFLSSEGGRTSDAILALNYAVSMGAVISSNSWGGASHSLALESAVQSAKEGGHLFIAAAGNMGSSNDFVPTFPCNYEAALCVAATTSTEELADYSNYGVNSVEIAAPGTDIMSTYIGNSYASLSGTSMATPHVAGAAALVWSWMGQRFVSDAAGDLRAIILESAQRPSFLNGWVSHGMLDVNGMVLKAESRNWLRLLQPPNGSVDATGTIASVLLDALGEVNTSLEIGHEFLAVGTYEAHILISGSDHEDEDEAVVPVQLTILGSPYLPAGIFQGMLDFGVVPLGGEGRRTIRLWNYGNGTARVKLNPLASPFAGPLVEVSVEPHESMDLIVTCRPTRTGQFAGNASFGTNSGLPAVEASLADATEKGEQFSMAMSCKGSEAPHLELDSFSGAVLLQADGLPFHFTPCVPAQWEANFLDAQSPDTNVTAPLAVVESSNLEGCLPHQTTVAGHIVLVSRGGCTFQEKITLIQDAGGLGGLYYDTEGTTTLRMMGTADVNNAPTLPAFMVSRSQGLALRDRVLSGEVLMISLIRRPIVLHTHLPGEGSPRAYGQLGMLNLGGGLLHWSTEIDMLTFEEHSFYSVVYPGAANSTAGPDVAPLPPAPVPSWTESSMLTEDAYFRNKDIDDDASPLALTFPMPFYGQVVQDVQMSSNGLIAMAPDSSTFRKGSDYWGHLPSEALPNGLLAAYWNDLRCSASHGCRLMTGHRFAQNEAGSCGNSNATIIQYKDFVHRYDMSAVVSVEARLYADGCMELQYDRIPGQEHRSAAKIGIETRSGRSGLNLAPVLPVNRDERFGIMFVPFLAADPRRPSTAAVKPGETSDFHFHVEGYRSKQAWIMVRASDGTGHWNSERVVRVVQQVFSYSWKFSAWGPCTKLVCSSSVGEEGRTVYCGGSDGGVYDVEHCSGPPTCTDTPGWRDSYGDTCQTYATNLYCTAEGGYGPGWKWFWGSFEDYRRNGHIAPTACCACGGGALVDSQPESVRACSEPTQGPDLNGDGVDDCAPAIAPPAPVTETTTETSSTATQTTETTTTQTATSATQTSSTSQTGTITSVTQTSSTDTQTSRTTSSTSTATWSSTSVTQTITTTATVTATLTSTLTTTLTTRTTTVTSTATSSWTRTSSSQTSTISSSATRTETTTGSTTATITSTSISLTSTTATLTSTASLTSTSISGTRSSTISTTTQSSTLSSTISSTASSTTSSSTTASSTLTATSTLTTTSTTESDTVTSTGTTSTSLSFTATTTTSSTTSSSTGTETTRTITSSGTQTSTLTSSETSTTISTSISSTKTSTVTSTSVSRTATTSVTTTSSSQSSTSVTSTQTTSSLTVTLTSTTSLSSSSTTTITVSSTTSITTTTVTKTTSSTTSSTSTRSTSISSTTTSTKSSTATSSSSTTSTSSSTVTWTTTVTTTTSLTSSSNTMSSTHTSTKTITTTTSSSVTTSRSSTSTLSSTVTTTTSSTSSSTSTSVTSTDTSTTSQTSSTTSSSTSSSTSTSTESSTSKTSSTSRSSSSSTSVTVTHTDTSTTTGTSSVTVSSTTSSSSTSSSSTSSSSLSSSSSSVSSTVSSSTSLSTSSSSTTSTSSSSITTSSTTTTSFTSSSLTMTSSSSTSSSSSSSSLTSTTTSASSSTSSSTSTSTSTTRTSTSKTGTTSSSTTSTSTSSSSTASTTSKTTTTSTTTTSTSSTSTATSTSTTVTTSTSSTTTSTSISSTISTSTSSSFTSTSKTFTSSTSGTTSITTTLSSSTTLSTTSTSVTTSTSKTLTSTKTSSTSSSFTSTTSQTSSSSLTSSSSSSSSSTSGTTTSMTSSTHTATVTSSSTTSSSTISDTTTISVTGTSSTTATVTRTSQTLSSTTSISKTWTSTSFTETTSTQTRNGPPVQILSEPEDVMTIDSTLLVLGVNDTTPGLEDSLQDSISSTVGVDPRRVAISDLGMTLAAVLDDGLRRRLSMMELALEVNFQVILTGESESSELGSSSAASVLSAVSAIKDDPSALVSKLSNTLAVETPLRARLTTPKLQQKQAVIVAEEWGTCGPGLTCARSEQLLLRYRAVWCADAENISVQLSSAMCFGNAPRTMEPCPDTVTHPPSCGWHLGSWSECRSQVSDKNSTDVVDNMTTPCDSSGIGHQQREVRCLAQDPAIDCGNPPERERECQCISSQLQLQRDHLQQETAQVLAASPGPLLIGLIAGGCIACTCCAFCCFSMVKGNQSTVKKLDKSTLQDFDGPAAEPKRPDAPQSAVTVCVAAGRRSRDGEERPESPEDGDSTVACSVQSPLPSPSHAPSYQSRVTPLASPCSIASVSSQPIQLPLPSPSAMSVSSINAVLQSPAHSMQGSGSPDTMLDGLEFSPRRRSNGPSSPKKRSGPSGPSLPVLSEHQSIQGAVESETALFAALSSPSNFLRPASPSKLRAASLPPVAEVEKQRDPPLPSQAQSDSEGHNSVNTQKQRKKKGPRPPTLELDRYLEDEAPLHSEQEDVEVNYATSPSKSPSKRNASHAFAPAWLRDDGEACGGGTPSHAERFELKSMPPQPLLPQPPTPGGTIPPPPIPKNPEPPSQAPQGLRRGNSKVDFPSVPPSPSTKSTPVAQELSESALPSAPNLPPPPRLASRESEVFSVFSL